MEISSIQKTDNLSFKKSKLKEEKNVGSLTAFVGAALAKDVFTKGSAHFAQKVFKSQGNIPAEDIVKVNSALAEALKETGLAEKGVEIIRVKENSSGGLNLTTPAIKTVTGSKSSIKFADFVEILPENKEAKDIIKQDIELGKKNNILTKLFSKLGGKKAINDEIEFRAKLRTVSIEKGLNAFTLLNTNKIVMPELKLSLAGFHEIGHALNANFSKTGKILQKMRPTIALAPVILLISAFGRQKPESENKVKNAYNKTINFIRDNAGMLAFASAIPMLVEEGMASFKGNRLAQKLIDKGLANKALKMNIAGFGSYLGFAIGAGVAAKLAVKIKDNIQTKHNIEVAAHNAVVSGQIK